MHKEDHPTQERIQYYLVRIFTYPLSFFPYAALHLLGHFLGYLAFYFLKTFRKRTLSNLALAKDLKLNEKELIKTAKKTFQNLAITILEYPKLAREKDFSKLIICQNPEKAEALHKQKKGLIFFCGHQANWEVLFLDGNLRMKGIAIGKPFRNKRLYKWITSIREKTGGMIVPPEKALKEGLRGLKSGKFLGIVGDQGMPESEYAFPFLGRRAYTSTAPALLSYKTNSPIIVATTQRHKGKYYIKYSEPIFPDLKQPLEKETIRLMDASLKLLQASILEKPHQWLWQHNRYKQQTLKTLYRAYRFESIAIVLPEEKKAFDNLILHLPTLKKIYAKDFILLFIPQKYAHLNPIEVEEIIPYASSDELLKKEKEYRPKLVFNFSGKEEISKHFLKLSTLKVFTFADLKQIAGQNQPDKKITTPSEIFAAALCRTKTLKSFVETF